MRHFFAPALLALCLVLSGCITTPPLAPSDRHDVHALQSWTAEGKLGLKFRDKGGSLYFTWVESGDDFTLDMAGPLGQGQTRLVGKPGMVTLENSTTGHVEAASPEAVMQQTLGWQAPVSHLRYWLRGLPATADATVQRDASGDVSQIREDGWQADFERYTDAGTYHLPAKLVITGPDTRIVVVVSNWQPRPAP